MKKVKVRKYFILLVYQSFEYIDFIITIKMKYSYIY